jgi:hypothetical protein
VVREKKVATKMRKLNKKTLNKLTQERAKLRAQETQQATKGHSQEQCYEKVNHTLKNASSASTQVRPATVKGDEVGTRQKNQLG